MAFKKQNRVAGRFSRGSSSCISNINYIPEEVDNPVKGTLLITFHNPQIGTWVYHNVSLEEFIGLETAGSRGAFFNEHIRNSYSGMRIS